MWQVQIYFVLNVDGWSARKLGSYAKFAAMRRASSRLSSLGRRVSFDAKSLTSSLDHLVGARKQHRRYGETERLCGLEIDYKLEFCR